MRASGALVATAGSVALEALTLIELPEHDYEASASYWTSAERSLIIHI